MTQKFKELEDQHDLQQVSEDMNLGKHIKHHKKKLVPLEKLSYNGKSKAQYEKEAIDKINHATLAGIKNGENASKKLHSNAKVQTEQQTTEAVGKLKDKFDSTKEQVMAIVNNFG
jgi:hypothetical protein